MTRGRAGALALLVAAVLMAGTAFAAVAIGLDRLALWQVVRACVADYKLTGAAFPCLEVDLSGGEAGGSVVLRAPLTNDTIVVPTRRIVGVEDPFLQSAEAPNYFAAAWRARSFLTGADGQKPEREAVALVVNSAFARTQDQLHIHVACLAPEARRTLAVDAPRMPLGEWEPIGAIIPHTAFWGTRVRGPDLAGIEPFRLAAAALADKVPNLRALTIMVTGARVAGDDEFLILASYVGAPHSWWPVAAEDLFEPKCSADSLDLRSAGF